MENYNRKVKTVRDYEIGVFNNIKSSRDTENKRNLSETL